MSIAILPSTTTGDNENNNHKNVDERDTLVYNI